MKLLEESNLPKGVELAIGGGNPMDHPEIWQFLRFCFNKGIIVNMTMSIQHLLKANYFGMAMRSLDQGLIKGLGISIVARNFMYDDIKETINKFYKKSNNVVLHIIEGINDYDAIVNGIKDLNLLYMIKPKILILGKKEFGRFNYLSNYTKTNYDANSAVWMNNIVNFVNEITKLQGIVSFDNLAISRLNILSKFPNDVIKRCYMGKDGTHTFYCDLVNWEYAITSTAGKDSRLTIGNKNLRELYADIYRQSSPSTL